MRTVRGMDTLEPASISLSDAEAVGVETLLDLVGVEFSRIYFLGTGDAASTAVLLPASEWEQLQERLCAVNSLSSQLSAAFPQPARR